jgi:hypothetical protein
MQIVTAPTLRGWALASTGLLLLSGVFACEEAELQGAQAEVKETSVKLDLPAVPDFQIPQANSDGTHSIAEMRLRGNRYLGTEVKVKGYIIWVYDCATAIRTAEMTEDELNKILTDSPERCYRPNVYLGDEPNTPADRGIWLVEVPRPPREDEVKTLDEVTLQEMQAAWDALPKFAEKDQIVASGMWELSSPRGFKNSDGLLVYSTLENLTNPAAPAPEKN